MNNIQSRHKLALIFSILATLVSIIFLFKFESNLHCTQWTSFTIAVFDMEPHIEESRSALVYTKLTAIPMRTILASLLLSLIFWPGIVIILRIKKLISFKRNIQFFGVLLTCSLIATRSRIFIGERFQSLFGSTIVLALLLYIASILVDLFLIRKLEEKL